MTTALYPFVSATSQVDKVMELANLRNGITDVKVSSVNCTLELPLVIDPLLNNGRNTSIVIKAILGKDYHGSRTVKYERLPIEKFLTGLTPTMPVPAVNSVVNVAAVTGWLRTAYGLDVVATDFTLSPIDTSVLPAAGTLTVKDTSLLWTGGFAFIVDYDVLDLVNLLTVTELDGFEYPSSDLTKGQAQVYSWSFDGTDFTHELESHPAGSAADTTAIAELLSTVAGDEWVLSGTSAPFNLTGSTVLYNGLVAGSGVSVNTKYTKVLVLQLGALCSNLGGKLTIWYGLK